LGSQTRGKPNDLCNKNALSHKKKRGGRRDRGVGLRNATVEEVLQVLFQGKGILYLFRVRTRKNKENAMKDNCGGEGKDQRRTKGDVIHTGKKVFS